jgi:large subunit ribosomal protein L24
MNKLKVNDEVIITTGKDKGKKAKVLKVNYKTNRVLVDGLNLFTKSIKQNPERPSENFTEIAKPIHISNVALVSPKTGKATRVKIVSENGINYRVAVSCGSRL